MLERHGAHRKVVKSTSIGAIVLMDGADSKVICHPYHGGIYVAIEHHLRVVGDSDLVPQDLISYFLKEDLVLKSSFREGGRLGNGNCLTTLLELLRKIKAKVDG